MLSNGVGACFAKTYSKVADYYEKELLDYRKADKVYRMGLDKLASLSKKAGGGRESELSFNCNPDSRRTSTVRVEKELTSLQSLYERYCDRMMKRVEQEALTEINELRRNSLYTVRLTQEEIHSVRHANEQVYANKRYSYTKNQIILGGVPIYVDEEFRDEVIPQGTQTVEVFYDVLKEIDCFEAKKRKSGGGRVSGGNENYFVKKLKNRREEIEKESRGKEESWLDRQPYLKMDFNKRKDMLTPEQVHEEEEQSCLKSPEGNNRKRLSLLTSIKIQQSSNLSSATFGAWPSNLPAGQSKLVQIPQTCHTDSESYKQQLSKSRFCAPNTQHANKSNMSTIREVSSQDNSLSLS
ncbi:hypothetical protein FGO68_gene3763 [Halteria grandinella]|uniref:Uncharacterized protein n=1 Tax=Halteria grandinella TaxID=5974 RepID=A0A8J8NEF3_HALGN|nr:hypothetical protein FGO68_gene3763 [Halteria grandinella]